jgi:hypothetical protein
MPLPAGWRDMVMEYAVTASLSAAGSFSPECSQVLRLTLHEEHAAVLRQAISNPTYANKTIEVAETVEQAVVSNLPDTAM